jgi:hypothetical protein
VGGDLDQVALFDVLNAAQPGAAQAADVEDEGEAALDFLRPQLESLAGDRALEPCPVVVDRPPGRVVTLPAGESLLLLLRACLTDSPYRLLKAAERRLRCGQTRTVRNTRLMGDAIRAT